ncbi:hypothetical protein OIE66_14055 [Nonomuraea sp. NBC_01738]|uniref:DUF2231 domain-containing protein n=1 Tax=Nonomuraea sp. NBC_01738 TaxID=2976003 RepID=UPI002E141E86|nr:hypothetical protein OIE66_14055 [Nonomuraea sp. NBC_01738]
MFDEVLGLPAHPLIIHFAVVLTPLLAAVSVVYALVPRWRELLAWAVVALAVAAPLAVFAARQSGLNLRQSPRMAGVGGAQAERIATHQSFATPLLISVIALGVAALLLVFAARNRTAGLVLGGLTIVLAAVAAYYVFRAGDSGARAVWSL